MPRLMGYPQRHLVDGKEYVRTGEAARMMGYTSPNGARDAALRLGVLETLPHEPWEWLWISVESVHRAIEQGYGARKYQAAPKLKRTNKRHISTGERTRCGEPSEYVLLGENGNVTCQRCLRLKDDE